MATRRRPPVYFVSHGSPMTMYDTKHPAYTRLQMMGKEITQKVKPSAVVVFSAHWQAQRPGCIEINVGENEPLLYDFYGFPRHYYAEKYPNKGSATLARQIKLLLEQNGINVHEANRGLDHGVFVPFKVMFDPASNPLTVPIVQVSLFEDDTDAAAHLALGKAVQSLRDDNVLIVASGMSVHNLRDLAMALGGKTPMPYVDPFDEALRDAVETEPGKERNEKMQDLLLGPDAERAHPSFEHLVPIHVAVGAAGDDQGRRLWTMGEASAAWAQYRFGEVQS